MFVKVIASASGEDSQSIRVGARRGVRRWTAVAPRSDTGGAYVATIGHPQRNALLGLRRRDALLIIQGRP